jgi:anti-sigma B factor antagonist
MRSRTDCEQTLMLEGRLLGYFPGLMQPAQLDLEKVSATNGSNLVTRLSGKLSLETVHNFIQTLRPEPAAHLVLDMSGVTFLDSAGVGALVSLFVHRRNTGKSFALAGLTQQGMAVMQVAGLTKLVPIFPTVEAALEGRN